MSVLVTTVDGYHIFTSSGKHLTSLEGHRVEASPPGPGGTWLAIVDRQEIWQHGTDGEWTPLAKTDVDAHRGRRRERHDGVRRHRRRACAARWYRSRARSKPLDGFDTVPGRDEWHQVGHRRSRCAR